MFRLNEIMKTSQKRLQPVLSLVPEVPVKISDDKSKFITFELKVRAGQPAGSTSYKKYVRVFEEGSPQQWIELMQDLREIWTQNTINGPSDRTATVRSLLKGETLTAFESALLDARTEGMDDDDVEAPAATLADIDLALAGVSSSIFPHRALEIQRIWMTRGMKKPFDMPFRKAAAIISKINNSLPLFPGGTADSKFSEQELVGLMEWSLPARWRAKFDLDSYIPTLDTKAKLISECEAIERNEQLSKERKDNNNNNKKVHKKTKFTKFESRAKFRGNKRSGYFCRKCGQNNTHSTPDCWILKRAGENNKKEHGGPANNNKRAGKPFFQREERKEAHATNRKRAGRKASNKNKTAESKRDDSSTASSTTSSSSAVSVNNMELDQIGTLGIENLNIKIKKEPEDWVHVEDETTCWEEI